MRPRVLSTIPSLPPRKEGCSLGDLSEPHLHVVTPSLGQEVREGREDAGSGRVQKRMPAEVGMPWDPTQLASFCYSWGFSYH